MRKSTFAPGLRHNASALFKPSLVTGQSTVGSSARALTGLTCDIETNDCSSLSVCEDTDVLG